MSNTKLYLIVGSLTVVVVILLVVLIIGDTKVGGKGEKYDLEFWGIFDDGLAFKDIIEAYRQANPNIRVNYRSFPFEGYEDAVINALAEGRGPDIWMIQNTWLPKYASKLLPFPQPTNPREEGYRISNFRSDFVDVAYSDLTNGTQIYAMPLFVDTLALYYNKDLLQSAGFINPPADWENFQKAVLAVTRREQFGQVISQSGVALGTARNVNRSTDVLALLMLQSGVRMTNPEFTQATFAQSVEGIKVGEQALTWYTDFANPLSPKYTWNDQMSYSIDAFAEGKTAMMINYSHHIPTIRSKSARLNFAIAPVPQFKDANILINYANYLALAVPRLNDLQRQLEAWKFIIFATSNQGEKLYISATSRPPARRDVIQEVRHDRDLGVFAIQALTARSWYQAEPTTTDTILANMIDDVNFGRLSAAQALQSAQDRVSVLMRR